MLTDVSPKVRPVSTGDFTGLSEMLLRLSPESLYYRFHIPLHQVPEHILRRLVEGHDPGERRLVAVSGARIIGHAMSSAPERGEAEVGVVVEDRWQSSGVGRMLLQRLAAVARHEEVEAFTCVSLWENRRVTEAIKALCPAATYEVKDGLRLIRAPLGDVEPEKLQNVNGKQTGERVVYESGRE